jgi:VWFA-related protein
MKRSFGLLIILLMLSFYPTLTFPQETREPMRIRVTAVPVDVIVTDKDGRPVLDLTKEDFEIYEDGKRQVIENFELILFDGTSAPETRLTSPEGVPGSDVDSESKLSDPTRQRTFLIMFGRGRNTEFNAADRVIEFIGKRLQPTDQVAVLAYNRATPFTTNHQAIVSVLRRYKSANEEIDGILSLQGHYFRPKTPADKMSDGVQARIDAVFALESLTTKTVLPSKIPPGADVSEDAENMLEAAERMENRVRIRDELLQRAGLGEGFNPDSMPEIRSPFLETGGALSPDFPPDMIGEYLRYTLRTGWDVSNIYSALEYLRYMPGEKHLLFFSREGLFLPTREKEEIIGRFACDSRVRIHSIHTGGSVSAPLIDFDMAADWRHLYSDRRVARNIEKRREGQTFAQRSMVNLSQISGGKGFLMTDPLEALEEVDKMTRSVYLLAYRPEEDKAIGEFRRIDVKVKHKNMRVYHRQGYFINRKTALPDMEKNRGYARIISAAGFGQEVQDFAMELDVSNVTEEKKFTSLKAVISMYFGKEMVEHNNGLYQVELPFTSFFLDRQQKLIHQSWDTIELNLSESSLQRLIKNGLAFQHHFQVPGKLQGGWIKVVIYDPRGDRISSIIREVRSSK